MVEDRCVVGHLPTSAVGAHLSPEPCEMRADPAASGLPLTARREHASGPGRPGLGPARRGRGRPRQWVTSTLVRLKSEIPAQARLFENGLEDGCPALFSFSKAKSKFEKGATRNAAREVPITPPVALRAS